MSKKVYPIGPVMLDLMQNKLHDNISALAEGGLDAKQFDQTLDQTRELLNALADAYRNVTFGKEGK